MALRLELDNPQQARTQVERIDSRCSPIDLLDALAGEGGPILLESSARDGCWGRYSIAAAHPLLVLTQRDGCLSDQEGKVYPGKLLGNLRKISSCVTAAERDDCPYLPGWMGFLGYELGREFERLPSAAKRDTSLPDLHLAFYDAVAVHDSADDSWRIVSLSFENKPAGAGVSAEILRRAFANAGRSRSSTVLQPVSEAFLSNFSRQQYERAVERCIEYIAQGDIFQVNLSQRFSRAIRSHPLELYRHLRRRNPAGYSAYIAEGNWAILSSSPELFLRCRGGQVITRPIKGTRRRTGDFADDEAAARNLVGSPKDNAELAMIIDLMRNDLGRVCRYGSVRVTTPRCLETHPTVFHLVGTVEGQLHERFGLAELLRATFPGGSITGAPKIRAMEIIDEMETYARGAYTGSVVHLGCDGSAELSIAIRTAVCDGGRVYVSAGGGIVADSDPSAEYIETLDKARALLETVNHVEADFCPQITQTSRKAN